MQTSQLYMIPVSSDILLDITHSPSNNGSNWKHNNTFCNVTLKEHTPQNLQAYVQQYKSKLKSNITVAIYGTSCAYRFWYLDMSSSILDWSSSVLGQVRYRDKCVVYSCYRVWCKGDQVNISHLKMMINKNCKTVLMAWLMCRHDGHFMT